MPVPSYQDLFNPVIQSLKKLGGSASISELNEQVTKSLSLTEKEIAEPHNDHYTKLEYRLAWARTYLKKYGFLDNSARGVWVLTEKGRSVNAVNPRELRRSEKPGRNGSSQVLPTTSNLAADGSASEVAEALLEQSWRQDLRVILSNIRPDVFERLCQRLLRESGFVEVRVTGRTGDGGIDGVGRVKIGGLLGFPIVFQCKRYQGSVGASVVREFRGAMMGRADRGLLLTTGTFTRDARQEATRDGVPPIDLVDGEELLEKLKELRLGVSVKMIEEVSVLADWFKEI
jgi:restriction system protein